MGNEDTLDLKTLCPCLGMSQDSWRVKLQAGGCPLTCASTGSSETTHL